MNKTIEINVRYYLLGHDGSYDVFDRALELQLLPAMVFANGSESECREWVLRNYEEPLALYGTPWTARLKLDSNIFWEVNDLSGELVADFLKENDAHVISTAPAILALLEQYHKSFPTKESGKLIAQAKGWI